jgi:hypothetical protein
MTFPGVVTSAYVAHPGTPAKTGSVAQADDRVSIIGRAGGY